MTTWIDIAGWTLLHFVWQGTLIAGIAWAALRLLDRSAPQSRYAVACAALVLMLAAPLGTAWRLGSAPAVPVADMLPRQLIAVDRSQPAPLPASDAAPPAPPGSSEAATTAAAAAAPPAMSALVAIWALGVGLLLARLAGGCWRVRRLHHLASAEAPSRWQATADALAQRLRLTRPVLFVHSDVIDTPTVIGWLRPIVLLPIAALTNLTASQVEAILAHELAHVRRHDFVANLLQTAAEILLFYHPAVWWISSRIRAEREHCCDDVAVEVTGDAVGYAAALTELAAWTLNRTNVAVAATDGPLLSRVRRLLHGSPSGIPRSNGVLAVVLAVGVILVVGSVGAISRAQSSSSADAGDERPPGPARVNALLGFNLFPEVPRWPGDDPYGARAWSVTLQHADGEVPLMGFTGRSLIRHAYDAVGIPIVGLPEWVDQESFELSARSDRTLAAGVADPDAMNVALRSALDQRLGIVTHREMREFAVYRLVKANADGTLGPNLRPSVAACWDDDALKGAGTPGNTTRERGQRFCGIDHRFTNSIGLKMTMAEFAASIRPHDTPLTPRFPVVDATGLQGAYDFELNYGPIPLAAIGYANPAIGWLMAPFGIRSLFTALPEQLGLKLEEATAPFEVLVVDEIRRPT